MTARKRFKRLVRARAARTSESYSAALRHFRAHPAEEVQVFDLQRIEKPHHGFAIQLPPDWAEELPNLTNSSHEVARYYRRGEGVRGIIVFRDPHNRALRSADKALEIRPVLESAGYRDFHSSETRIAGRPATCLTCELREGPEQRPWSLREYFVLVDGVSYVFAVGTTDMAGDGALLSAVAVGIELFAPRVQESLPDSVLGPYYPNPRKAIALGQELARNADQPLGGHHIVAGLVEIGVGVAFDVLSALGITAGAVRAYLAQRPSSPARELTGVTVTPNTYRLLANVAPSHAVALGHNYVGTEHILLGIATDEASEGWEVLAALGLQRQAVRDALADHFERPIERHVRGVHGR